MSRTWFIAAKTTPVQALQEKSTSTYTHTYTYTHIHIHTYVYIHIHVYIYTWFVATKTTPAHAVQAKSASTPRRTPRVSSTGCSTFKKNLSGARACASALGYETPVCTRTAAGASRAGSLAVCVTVFSGNFSKVSCIVTVHSKASGGLTFENSRQISRRVAHLRVSSSTSWKTSRIRFLERQLSARFDVSNN